MPGPSVSSMYSAYRSYGCTQVTISVLHPAISKRSAPFSATSQLRNFVIPAAPQPEFAHGHRPPVYHILWVRGFRAHTISRRGFNLFKPLRRHFPATRCCRQVPHPLAPRCRRPKRSVQKIEDRLGGLRQDGGTRTNIERLRRSGKKFVERLGSYATLPNPKSFPQVFEGIFSSK